MSSDRIRRPLGRVLGEAVIIICSVYVAIVLEGLASERSRRTEADGALERLRAELVLDRADADGVLRAQREIGDDYSRLVSWLGSPATMPADSVDAALERLGLSNPTAYPRKGAWTSLSTTGLLSAIHDRDLVVRIADHYENLVARVEYNGNDYDELLNGTMIEAVPLAWDPVEGRPRGDLTVVRGRLDYLWTVWNDYYRDLVGRYAVAIDSLITDLDDYLGSEVDAPGTVRLP